MTKGALPHISTIYRDEMRSYGTGVLAKKEVSRMAASVLAGGGWLGLVTVHGKDTNDNPQTFDVVISRVFDAPLEEVWKAWSDPEYVTQWWGPTGFTSPSAEMDFRVGGASLVCMRAPADYGGQDTYHTWTYTRIDPHERIEFVSNFAEEDATHLDPAAMGLPPGINRLRDSRHPAVQLPWRPSR
jgi:uncharacterized protein YndB with AHSA1/START domain